jgi:hypothetical protein
MKRCTSRLGAILAAATAVTAAAAPVASADAPSFSRCPTTTAGVVDCVVFQSTSGSIGANSHSINVGSSLTLEGGIAYNRVTRQHTFVPPTSGDALTGQPITVASNLFGSGLPFTLNTLTATIQQAGPVDYNFSTEDITAPIQIRFSNPLLGSGCTIGSTADPLSLNLTTGTTSPPAPNAPITGDQGTLTDVPGTDQANIGVVEVDNAYAVPAAQSCGSVAQTLVTRVINQQLGLPSPAGTNTASVTGNDYLKAPAS